MKLFEKMQTKAEQQFNKHKSDYILYDFEIDKEELLQTEGNDFIWIIRDLGTQLLDIEELKIIDSLKYTECNCYMNCWKDSFKAYKLDIKKQEIIPIKKIEIQNILNFARDYKKVVVISYKEWEQGSLKTFKGEHKTYYDQKAIRWTKEKLEYHNGITSDKIKEIAIIEYNNR